MRHSVRKTTLITVHVPIELQYLTQVVSADVEESLLQVGLT